MNEAGARINIDDALRRAGWDPSDRSGVQIEVAVPFGRSLHGAQAGGRADYVLYNGRGRALAVIEAKTSAVEQELDRWAAEGGFVPPPRETPGFKAYYLVDAGNGVVVSISLFGDRDGAEESTRGAAEWVSRNLADLIRLPPQVLTGEVVAQRTMEHPPLA